MSSCKCPVYEKAMALDISYSQALEEYDAQQVPICSNGTFFGVINASKDTEIEQLSGTITQLQT